MRFGASAAPLSENRSPEADPMVAVSATPHFAEKST
jgi:hypothetical protein